MSKYTVANNVPFDFSERAKAILAQPDLGAHGGFSLPIEVTGFWSDVITLYVNRDWSFRKGVDQIDHTWSVRVSHSSGGNDDREGVDNLQAELNFAAALVFAVQQGRALQERFPEFEARAQAEYQRERAEREAEKAAQQARVDADKPLGERRAKAYLDAAIATRKGAGASWSDGLNLTITLQPRGDVGHSQLLIIGLTRNDAALLRLNGRTVTRAQALEALAAASERTQPAAKAD